MPGLVRALSVAGRLGFAVSLALLALAVTRWAPIEAQAPLDVRALPLAGPALGFAVLAALTGRDRRPGPWRRVALALVAAVATLGSPWRCAARRGSRPRCRAPRERSARPAPAPST